MSLSPICNCNFVESSEHAETCPERAALDAAHDLAWSRIHAVVDPADMENTLIPVFREIELLKLYNKRLHDAIVTGDWTDVIEKGMKP